MKTKIKKLIFEYSTHSRITTKELGKKIGSSQQSASYLLNMIKKRKSIESPTTIVDAIKLGFMNILVGFNLINPGLKKEIIDELKQIPSITSIEECKEGIDLLVEYTVPNLSAFNKIHTETISKQYKQLRTEFIYPIIVVHHYNKNYLLRRPKDSDIILFGDRITRDLSERENLILNNLVNQPDKKLIDISEDLDIPVKTVIKIKKGLEKKYIIRGYGAILNHKKLEIIRNVMFIRFSSEGIKQIENFYEYTKNNKNIIRFIKLIGEYQMAIYFEALKEEAIIKEIRSNFPVESYHIIKSEKIHKKRYLPE
jgi:DNA-binding Lrp family transcriptional regulator